ncbi:MAG: phenylalanine--tRNA ligase subunit beta [Desulfovibrio sp.]|jgi:phenylalanyl-tRNA synthetase beta chain|nr:phenylalanine--tRNA ligase subunit beta [Desulfovibrio sp.]
MLLSMNWLREFLPYADSAESLGDRLTMAGLETENILRPHAALNAVVTGLVAACARHPAADKLSVCRVDVGDEVLDIVCGAPNVAAGQKVAVIRAGRVLPGGQKVSKAVLRGAPSNGMICSERELGFSDEHDGILVLDPSVPVGKALPDALELDDEVLDLSVTPNRGDCLSVLGLACETAALTGLPLNVPDYRRFSGGADAASELALVVEDEKLCPLYHGLIIEGLTVAPSPLKLRCRLNAVGVRPVSNLVDATNYILMEFGQPLHAFDLDRIRGGRVIVRAADEGERFTTLDGKERALTAGDITIRDAGGVICLGGVMGGLNSEISEHTRRVFLESAVFHPGAIRGTARRLGLHSEASYRFERGVDPEGATPALERAAHMAASLAGGRVRPGLIKKAAQTPPARAVHLHREYAERLLGATLDSRFCEKTLCALGCTVRDASGGLRAGEENIAIEWDVTPPARRPDLTRAADLAEELVRVYGVDRIPARLPGMVRDLARSGRPESKSAFLSRIKHWGRQAGLNEIIAYSFAGGRELDLLGVPGAERVPVLNPLSEDMDVLRPALIPGLLGALRNNLAQGAPSVRLFETAAVFGNGAYTPPPAGGNDFPRTSSAPDRVRNGGATGNAGDGGPCASAIAQTNTARATAGGNAGDGGPCAGAAASGSLPEETVSPAAAQDAFRAGFVREETRLGIILHGARSSASWPPLPGDLGYLDLKGLVEHLLLDLALPAADFVPAGADAPERFLPCVDVVLQGTRIGRGGRVKEAVAARSHAKKEVWCVELNLDILYGLHTAATVRAVPLPVFPPVRRDVTFVAPPGTRAGDIAALAETMKGRISTEIRLVDCYEPEGTDARSLTFRLTFRSADRTLKDEEADRQLGIFSEKVCKALNVAVRQMD